MWSIKYLVASLGNIIRSREWGRGIARIMYNTVSSDSFCYAYASVCMYMLGS